MNKKQIALIDTLRKGVRQLNDLVAVEVKLAPRVKDAYVEEHIQDKNSISPGYAEAEISYGDKLFRACLFQCIDDRINADRVKLYFDVEGSPILPVGDCKQLYNVLSSLEESVCLALSPVPDKDSPKISIEGVHTTIPLVQSMHKILADAFGRLSISAEVIQDRLAHGEGHDHWKSDVVFFVDEDDDDGVEPFRS